MTAVLAATGQAALRAWTDGDTATAIETADRVLASGTDPECLAAGVAAAAAAADGALTDAASRWRALASTVDGIAGASALGRAALTAGLAGDVATADRDLAAARRMLSGSAPRGLTVLFDGVEATVEAVRGGFDRAARRLAGLAVTTVPADPLTPERWEDLAVIATLAAGDRDTAREMLAVHQERTPTVRRRLLTAWLDLKAGRLAEARAGLAASHGERILLRDAVLAAAITIGLVRRAGGVDALRATWHRVAPVVAGAEVEPLLLDVWGELAVGAAGVSRSDAETIGAAMSAAVARAGAPCWAAGAEAWWALQRAVATDDRAGCAAAADRLTSAGDRRAATGRVWASILAGDVDPAAVGVAAEALARGGEPWEAAVLYRAAATRLTDPVAARDLLSAGRAHRVKITSQDRTEGGGLSERERAVGELLLDGLTHKEIGTRLYLSPKTVEQHAARLRQKLGATTRGELIVTLRARLK